MNDKENKLASHLLLLAENEFANHVCNDLEPEIWKDWTLDERREFVKEFWTWNGDPNDYNPDYLNLPDYALMQFLAHKLSQTPHY